MLGISGSWQIVAALQIVIFRVDTGQILIAKEAVGVFPRIPCKILPVITSIR
jgi:hypothetical protein